MVCRTLAVVNGGRLWFVMLASFLYACLPNDIGEMEDAHAKKVESENRRYEVDEKRYAICDDAPAGATCGLLFDQINPDRFKVKACGLPPEVAITDDCYGKLVAVFYRQLRDRYPLADWQKVEAYCRGASERCNSLRDVERALLQTHNANAERQHDEATAALEKKHRSDVESAEEENFLLSAGAPNAALNPALMNPGVTSPAPAPMPGMH